MRVLLVCVASLLAGCISPAPSPADAPPEVIVGTANALPTAVLLDPYVGDYRNGAALMRVRRSGTGLLIDAPAGTLGLTLVGLDTFVDTQGNSYLFAMPRGAPATQLAIIGANGTRREWVR